MKNFALIGVGGFIAPRHLKAIKDTGNAVVAALDPNDSVGIIDSFFPDADFFTEFERFDRHTDKLRRAHNGRQIDYVSICSPNYLHDAHIRFALRSGSNALCEKPIVLNARNIDGLLEVERESGKRIYTVLQLRLHPAILALKERVAKAPKNKKFDLDLTYITSRGHWYFQSWKGDVDKSGGVATNIGVHFYDMLHFVFGNVVANKVHHRSPTKVAGYLEFDRARVRWFLSVDCNDLPIETRAKNQRTYRSIRMGDEDIEFSDGFSDLHTRIYEDMLSGGGFGLEENRVAIETVGEIREAAQLGLQGDYHPFLRETVRA
jgi:UDP-N-acetyl-2-amino-2-deoxyglucuronate dehydrogenase